MFLGVRRRFVRFGTLQMVYELLYNMLFNNILCQMFYQINPIIVEKASLFLIVSLIIYLCVCFPINTCPDCYFSLR